MTQTDYRDLWPSETTPWRDIDVRFPDGARGPIHCAGWGARETLVATDRLADLTTGACYGCLVAALDQVATGP